MDKKAKALEGQLTTRPPLFDGSNFAYWEIGMMIFLTSCDFDLWQVILDGHMDPTSEVTTMPEKMISHHVYADCKLFLVRIPISTTCSNWVFMSLSILNDSLHEIIWAQNNFGQIRGYKAIFLCIIFLLKFYTQLKSEAGSDLESI